MTTRRPTHFELLQYAVKSFDRCYVNDGDDAKLQDVPRASLAQSTSEPRGNVGINFYLRDEGARLLAEGRVELDGANRRHLRFWMTPGGGTVPDMLAAIDREERSGLS